MTTKEHIFLKLAEECSEVQHRVLKLLQFGDDEIQEGHTENNLQRLMAEINDLRSVVTILEGRKLIPIATQDELAEAYFEKSAKIEKYLQISRERGLVT